MSPSKTSWLALGVASVAAAAVISGLAFAATERVTIGDLGNNEGILVDLKAFKIVKGKAQSDPMAELVKLGAKQVAEGAIVFRYGDKLYIADGVPAGGPQAINPGQPLPSTIDGFNRLFQPY